MAFRIIGTLHNIGSGNFPADGQQLVNHENLRQAPWTDRLARTVMAGLGVQLVTSGLAGR
jgi:hypothetical protein